MFDVEPCFSCLFLECVILGRFVFFPQVEGRYLDIEKMLSEDCWWNLQEQLGVCVFNVLIFNWQQIEPFGYRQILLPPPSLP